MSKVTNFIFGKPRQTIPQKPQRPPQQKKKSCRFKYREKPDGFDIDFSPECNAQERAEIMKQINERRNKGEE